MDKKVLTIGFAAFLIAVFLAGIYAYTSLDNRVKNITQLSAEKLTCDIKEQKAQIDALAAELRIKADLALFNKYDNYFIALNRSVADVRDRLARIEGRLSLEKNN